MDYTNPNKVKFPHGLVLTGFDWKWEEARYRNEDSVTHVSVLMETKGAKYSREFTINKPAAWDEKELYKQLLKLPEFKGSKPI